MGAAAAAAYDPIIDLQKLKGQHSYLYLFTGAGVQRQGPELR